MKVATPPQLSFEPAFCPDARPNPTASYCPATNTITVDMPALTLMGTSLARGGPFQGAGPLFGDYSAFSVLASRYLLATEKQHAALPLDNTNTGLRTACLTGVFTTKLAKPVTIPSGASVALSGGDLDEAVSGDPDQRSSRQRRQRPIGRVGVRSGERVPQRGARRRGRLLQALAVISRRRCPSAGRAR